MTYIELINEFWRQNGFMPFGAMDTTVYFYLLHQCNIRGWHNPFQLQTRDIEFHLSITRKQLGESKNRLKHRGLIDFSSGSRKKSPTYTIIGLSKNMFPTETQTETQVVTQTETQMETQTETQPVTHNKTKIKTKTKDLDLKEKPPIGVKKKKIFPKELIAEYRQHAEDENYLRFLQWLEQEAPYVASNLDPLSEEEFSKLKQAYGSNSIMTSVLNIENRKDLRKKYSSLYRTLLNWCKNGFYD